MAALTRKQGTFVLALLKGQSVETAAAEVGVSERTGYRWQNSPEVGAALEDGRARLFDDAVAALRAGALAAAAEIRELSCHAIQEGVRLRASIAVFDLVNRVDLQELERRLDALETAARRDELSPY